MKYEPQSLSGTYDRRGYLSRDQREATTVRVNKRHTDLGILAAPLVKGGQGKDLDDHEVGALLIGIACAVSGILMFLAAYFGR